jgi:D123 protein
MDFPRWPRAYFERIRPTFLESWPDELAALSIPHARVQLNAEEAKTLARAPCLWLDRVTTLDPVGLQTLAAKLRQPIDGFSDGAFIRLGSASPKDSPLFRPNRGRARQAVMAIKLLQTSERMRADISRCLELGYLPSVFVRQWLPLLAWQEFRCFMRDRRLVGISQLDCVNYVAHQEVLRAANRIEEAIKEFFLKFQACCHLDRVVFDVFVVPDSETEGRYQARLTEINPWGPGTDTCLFRWGVSGDFDGSFRYLT